MSDQNDFVDDATKQNSSVEPFSQNIPSELEKPNYWQVIAIVLLVLLVVSVAISVHFWQKTNSTLPNKIYSAPTFQPAQESLQSPVSTSSVLVNSALKDDSFHTTYTNEVQGYSLRLPSYMQQLKDTNRGVSDDGTINDADWRFGKRDLSNMDAKHKSISETGTATHLEIIVSPQNVSKENYDTQCSTDVLSHNQRYPTLRQTPQITGTTMWKESFGPTLNAAQPETVWWSDNICFMHNNQLYEIKFNDFEMPLPDQDMEEILSSFTFLK